MTLLTLWWVGVTVVGCGAMVAHTRSVVAASCADAAADAIVLAYVGHGEAVASLLATTLRSRIVMVITDGNGATHMTVESSCGTATSAAILG